MIAKKNWYVNRIRRLRKEIHRLRSTPLALLPDSDEELRILRSMTVAQLHVLSDSLHTIVRIENPHYFMRSSSSPS